MAYQVPHPCCHGYLCPHPLSGSWSCFLEGHLPPPHRTPAHRDGSEGGAATKGGAIGGGVMGVEPLGWGHWGWVVGCGDWTGYWSAD